MSGLLPPALLSPSQQRWRGKESSDCLLWRVHACCPCVAISCLDASRRFGSVVSPSCQRKMIRYLLSPVYVVVCRVGHDDNAGWQRDGDQGAARTIMHVCTPGPHFRPDPVEDASCRGESSRIPHHSQTQLSVGSLLKKRHFAPKIFYLKVPWRLMPCPLGPVTMGLSWVVMLKEAKCAPKPPPPEDNVVEVGVSFSTAPPFPTLLNSIARWTLSRVCGTPSIENVRAYAVALETVPRRSSSTAISSQHLLCQILGRATSCHSCHLSVKSTRRRVSYETYCPVRAVSSAHVQV